MFHDHERVTQTHTLSPDRAGIPEVQRRDKGESGTGLCKDALGLLLQKTIGSEQIEIDNCNE